MLSVASVRKSFGGRTVVKDVSLCVRSHEIVGLLGPNGAGKTTTFSIIVGNLHADAGSVTVDGRELTRLSMAQRARAGIGYLVQERSIFRRLSVEDNLRLILEMRDCSDTKRDQVFARLVSDFDLTPILDQPAESLSGGQQRRVEVARALATEPRYLLLDEPFSGIDPIALAELQQLITRLRERGYGVLITDHNVRETLAITDRSYIIHDGSVIADGTPAQIAADSLARRFFFGESFRLA